MTLRPLTAAAASATALALAGCDLSTDPYAAGPGPAPPPARVERTADGRPAGDAGPIAPQLPATAAARDGAGARRTPEAAAAAYADAAANWTADTLARQYDRMRALATGRLARELDAGAPDADSVRALAAADQANRGRLVAAARAPGRAAGRVPGRVPDRPRVIVVTREEAVNAGAGELAGARHVVYRATVARRADGWLLTAWELLP